MLEASVACSQFTVTLLPQVQRIKPIIYDSIYTLIMLKRRSIYFSIVFISFILWWQPQMWYKLFPLVSPFPNLHFSCEVWREWHRKPCIYTLIMSEAEQDRNVSKWREIPHHTHPSVIPFFFFFCPIKTNFLIKVNFVDLNTAEELTTQYD